MEGQELVLRSSVLEVTLLPEIGGKIRQIVDRRTGDALLVPSSKPYRQIPVGDLWTDFDTSGMDDCFPNIEPGVYPFPDGKSQRLFQMGEWVYGGWEVERANSKVVVLGRGGISFNYHARKTYRMIDSDTLEIRYAVENLSDRPFRYLWSAHPLFAVRGQFRLRLPSGQKFFRVFPGKGEVYQWPTYVSTNLSSEWLPRGKTLKIFLRGLSKGECHLDLAERSICVTFDLATTPILGLWFNNFGFPGSENPFQCIAIEPCTSPSDLLGELEASAYPVVEQGHTNQWWFRIKVE